MASCLIAQIAFWFVIFLPQSPGLRYVSLFQVKLFFLSFVCILNLPQSSAPWSLESWSREMKYSSSELAYVQKLGALVPYLGWLGFVLASKISFGGLCSMIPVQDALGGRSQRTAAQTQRLNLLGLNDKQRLKQKQAPTCSLI